MIYMGMKGRSLMKKISNTWGAAIISAATLMTFTGCAFKQPVYTAASTSGDAAANTSVTAASTSASSIPALWIISLSFFMDSNLLAHAVQAACRLDMRVVVQTH